ncbi:hypothetical protein [Paenibacillus xylanexedens]|nr:hypothetical protein [Paenibacillus xylanexedens]
MYDKHVQITAMQQSACGLLYSPQDCSGVLSFFADMLSKPD